MSWRRLSARESGVPDDGPYEGVPQHLMAALRGWINESGHWYELRTSWNLPRLVAACRISLDPYDDPTNIGMVLRATDEQPESLLDMVDAVLHFEQVEAEARHHLNELFQYGGSVWRVAPNGKGLVRQVDPMAAKAFAVATTPADVASEELTAAWTAAYGRHPDASDSWDHAIKAVEAALIPVAAPSQAEPTLGHVLGALGAVTKRGPVWELELPGHDGSRSVAPLVAMLRLIWPNPDRHGNANSRAPSLREAQAVVNLSVTIVQWARDGVLAKR